MQGPGPHLCAAGKADEREAHELRVWVPRALALSQELNARQSQLAAGAAVHQVPCTEESRLLRRACIDSRCWRWYGCSISAPAHVQCILEKRLHEDSPGTDECGYPPNALHPQSIRFLSGLVHALHYNTSSSESVRTLPIEPSFAGERGGLLGILVFTMTCKHFATSQAYAQAHNRACESKTSPMHWPLDSSAT